MNKNKNIGESSAATYSLKNFLPLIAILTIIVFFTLVKQILYGFNITHAMTDFMGSFFVVFGSFKIINLNGFAEAYSMYDIIAKRYRTYAYLYPFIELGLGLAYLIRYQLIVANWLTLMLMVIGSIGVAQKLAQKETVMCACLGAVFKIPMTYVTLAEDLIMGFMALFMLIKH